MKMFYNQAVVSYLLIQKLAKSDHKVGKYLWVITDHYEMHYWNTILAVSDSEGNVIKQGF